MPQLIHSLSQDVFINLAYEEWLLRKGHFHGLVLYHNSPCVVMGRFQNPWLECQVPLMNEMKIPLVRRISGGGCVYHDLNNLNFSFIHTQQKIYREENLDLLLKVLERLDIKAYRNERFDLIFDRDGAPFKFSGSAFKRVKEGTMHHGTLLWDSNLGLLNKVLNPKDQVIAGKGIRSHRSRVINLREIQSGANSTAFLKALSLELGQKIEVITEQELLNNPEIKLIATKLKSDSWIFGETPVFNEELRFKFDEWSLALDIRVKKGQIVEVLGQSSTHHPLIIQDILANIKGLSYGHYTLGEALKEKFKVYPEYHQDWQELLKRWASLWRKEDNCSF